MSGEAERPEEQQEEAHECASPGCSRPTESALCESCYERLWEAS